VDGDFRAYRALLHQHTPGSSAPWLAGQPPLKVTFMPPAADAAGHLATVYGRLNPGKTAARGRGNRSFVAGKTVPARGQARRGRLHPIVGTNRVLLGADAIPSAASRSFAALDGQGPPAGGPERQRCSASRRATALNLPGSAP
jgi:hypothetical protein